MDAARWDELETIFGQALALPPDERPAFLDRACRGDTALRSELDSLLDHYEEAPGYFDDLADAVPMPELPFAENSPPTQYDTNSFQIEGTRIAHYQVLEKLGGGGMGVVYKAEDTRLDRIAALKFLPPHLHADGQTRQRFIAEAKAASALDHPNICTIYEIGETDAGQLYIAMACYEGQTLKQKIKSGTLTVEAALDAALQMARGLAKAHGKGIVHRDIKPANVMITNDGVVKILDFGLAKMADVQLTRTGTTLGTIAYMSPEQTRGEKVDHRTDIWSLGVVLYEMLTGERPFKGDYDQAIVYSILHENPVPLTERNPDLSEELAHIVEMCLEKDKPLRYPDTADLVADLEVVTQGSGAGSASWSSMSAARRAHRRRRAPLPRKAVLAAGGVVLALAVVLSLLFLRPSASEAPASVPQLHLAVMPFTDAGAAPTEPAYREGLRLTLTSVLTRMSQYTDIPLWIVPASEVGEEMTITAVREAFGVNRVIEGRVRQDDGQINLDLDLSGTEPIRQHNSVTITKSPDAATSMETGLVTGLAELLAIPLTPQARRSLTAGGTADSRAYDFYLQGRAALERIDQPESIDSAIQLFTFALEEDSLYALAYAGLGRAYVYQYEHTKDSLLIARVEHNSRRALELDNRLAEARMTLGLLYVKTGAYDAALREYDLALVLDSTNADIVLDKAYVYEQLTRLDEAEATYLQGLKVRPDYHRLYNKLGHLYLRSRRYEEAATQFRTIIDLTPDNIWGYNNLGAVYYLEKRYEEARFWFERANEIQKNFLAYTNLGLIAYYEKQYSTAARMQEQAVALDSSNYLGWGNLARAYSRIPEERPKAYEAFQKAIQLAEAELKINPNSPRVPGLLAAYYRRLGVLYYGAADHANEARMYEQSLRYNENSSVMWSNLADAYGRIPEERHKARPTYQRAAQAAEAERETKPDDVNLLYRLVRLYLRLEQPTQARPILEQALSIKPDHVGLMAQAGRLYEQLDERETALEWIEKALQNGYAYEDIEEDSTLDALRADPRFRQIRDQTSSSS